jgi:hypothetical protein
MANDPNVQIDGDVLLMLKTDALTEERPNGFTIRVVQWTKTENGVTEKMGGPQLMKQQIYIKEGQIRTGKTKGYNAREFDLLLEKAPEIRAALSTV